MKIGDAVAIALDGLPPVLEGRVVDVGETGLAAVVEHREHGVHVYLSYAREHTVWARGWNNEATDALRAACALR